MFLRFINFKFHGDWGLGIRDWGLGIGPNPQSPIPISTKKAGNFLIYIKIKIK